ncbi:hypothetical protein E6Q11_05630 [Candidatus Dojkabacteria bacterium]|uniref:Uncharacterized protein n=1 Tax=Candidatus Dojkabacteria bacterium TaxID=2099670 RepID=A0A5C7J3G0_9BACT|nr:MAG: hypothetical protein E6Q11_05630 [Candidatus Dojkabacteria bacterium]
MNCCGGKDSKDTNELYEAFLKKKRAAIAAAQETLTRAKAAMPDSPLLPDEDFEKRLAICSTCPHTNFDNTRCTNCGCFLRIKARVKIFHCPIGKW